MSAYSRWKRGVFQSMSLHRDSQPTLAGVDSVMLTLKPSIVWLILNSLAILHLNLATRDLSGQESSANVEQASFRPLFNGKNLDGWKQVNCAKETFRVEDGKIVCSGVPTGVLRTDRQYENFVLELEWRHLEPKGNAGLFVWSDPLTHQGTPFTRAIEIQILDGRNTENYTSHGDVFAIQGATFVPDRPHPNGWMRCLPSERRCRPSPQWNHYRVTCQDGKVTLAVNGEKVAGGHSANPRKGYICLESEGGVVEYRNIKIHELPSNHPASELVAPPDEGFVSLYNGIDLSQWEVPDGSEGHWQPQDWILHYDGQSEADEKHLWSKREYVDFELICDWRWTAEPQLTQRPVIQANGEYALDAQGNQIMEEVPDAGDSGIYLRGSDKSQVNIWCWPVGSGEVYGYREDRSLPAEVRAAVTPSVRADLPIGQWNRFRIRMKGEYLTVDLNGQRVIDHAHLPGVAAQGKIALQHHGAPIEFANIFIKELTQAGE